MGEEINMHQAISASTVFIKMFRRWSAADDLETCRTTAMRAVCQDLGCTGIGCADIAAVACASLFELVEAHIGRRLTPECCCSLACSTDEAALLMLLHYAQNPHDRSAGQAKSHDLSAAIGWAAWAVRRELGIGMDRSRDIWPAAELNYAERSKQLMVGPFRANRGHYPAQHMSAVANAK
ncbi:hypothetical protein RM533_12475 [Croceicoccus sp. F390]|uniref:Uncharacterized protein n=1 Tax=Croceicoccus esteveae TaxID=3075597 RepID=A0ABU2ZK55_9SPHN|nr:hypothetical protein [Croceicoccus sp. F390]MDT0576983.1 hypothetical protein [Croceicoccus sp. F390]